MRDLDITLDEFKEKFQSMDEVYEEEMEEILGEDYRTQLFLFTDETYHTLIVKLKGKIYLIPTNVNVIDKYSPLNYYVMVQYARSVDEEDLKNILKEYEWQKKQADILGEVLEKNKIKTIFIDK